MSPRYTCSQCGRRRSVNSITDRCCRCQPEGIKTIQRRAIAAVTRAVKAGRLAIVRSLSCVDCGRPASAYEHRDYSKPLEVEPVCHSCNQKRGHAINLTREAA